MAGGYAYMPQGVDAMVAKFRDLQAQIDALRRALTGLGLNIDVNRNLIFQSSAGGAIVVVDADGVVIARIGALPAAFNRADGSTQPGLAFYREDGSLALFQGDLNPLTPPFKQSLQSLDRAGHVIFADDTNGGQGVALPYLTFGTPQSNTAPTDTTTSGTFTTLQSATGYWMSARMTGQILVRASDGTTAGEVRVTDATGTPVGSTITVAAGAFAYVNWGPTVVPGNFGDSIVLNFQARRTAGAGTIGVNASTPIGVQS